MELKEFVREKKWKNMKKDQWLILFLAGVLFLIVAMPTEKNGNSKIIKQQNAQTETAGAAGGRQEEADYEQTLEMRLEQILQGMDGVGTVQVMITLKDQGEAVVEKDVTVRQDTGSGGHDQDSGMDFIAEVERTFKMLDGVLIVAEGGADASVRKNISEEVEALFGLDAHKIKIVKMKTKGASN